MRPCWPSASVHSDRSPARLFVYSSAAACPGVRPIVPALLLLRRKQKSRCAWTYIHYATAHAPVQQPPQLPADA